MLINGEKFACEACVRGHRVSSCHHQGKYAPLPESLEAFRDYLLTLPDRPLVHVNKKGRPVSQCQHCRGLRKSRAQHVKCECHDKTHSAEDCPHDKQDGNHGVPTLHHPEEGHDADAHTDPQTCCCSHGSRCTCALKTEPHLDPVPEDIPQYIQPKDHSKQWHNKNSHDPKTTIFTNGHHKPVHKFNDAHNHLGAPYKIPSRSNSLHGHREIAQRSTDNLLLTKSAKPFHESPLHNSISEAMRIVERKVRSEHNSPVLGPTKMAANAATSDFKIPGFDPRAYAYSPFGTETPPSQPNSIMNSQNPSQQELHLPETFPDNWFMSYDQAHDYDPPAWARRNDGSSVDWNNLNADLNNNSGSGSNVYNMNSLSTVDSPYMLSQQAIYQQPLTGLSSQLNKTGFSPSSGEHSDAEEPSPASNNGGWNKQRPMSNELSSPGGDETSERYRLSSASSYFGTSQTGMPVGDEAGHLDIDDFLQQAEAETKRMQMQNQMAQMQMGSQEADQASRLSSVSRGMTPSASTPGSIGNEHSFTVREAVRLAHPDGLAYDSVQQPKIDMAPSFMAEDPSWSAAPDMSDPQLGLDDERDDEDWVR